MVKISDIILTNPDHQAHPFIFGKTTSTLLFFEASLDLHKAKNPVICYPQLKQGHEVGG